MASLTLGRLYPGEIPRYSFYRRLSGPQGQSGHEGVKKNLHPPTPGIEPGPSSPQPSALPLEPPGPRYIYIDYIILGPIELTYTLQCVAEK